MPVLEKQDSTERILGDLRNPGLSSFPETNDSELLLRAARLVLNDSDRSSSMSNITNERLTLALAVLVRWFGQGHWLDKNHPRIFRSYLSGYKLSAMMCTILFFVHSSKDEDAVTALTKLTDPKSPFDLEHEIEFDGQTFCCRDNSLCDVTAAVVFELASDWMRNARGERPSALGLLLTRISKWRHALATQALCESCFGKASADALVGDEAKDCLPGFAPAFPEAPFWGQGCDGPLRLRFGPYTSPIVF